ncbi:MAG: CRISPR-associated endonuclease Cas3'' [Nitrososphaerales archaeon]
MTIQLEYLVYADEQGRVETYEEHIKAMFSEWDKIRRRVIPSLIRLYDCSSEHMEFLVKSIILMHDIGKLTPIYQKYLFKIKQRIKSLLNFRHELVSVIWHYWTFKNLYREKFGESYENILSEAMASIITHHEYWALQTTKNYRPDYVISDLNKWFEKEIILIHGSKELLSHMAESLLHIKVQIAEQIPIKWEAYEALRVMFNHVDKKGIVAHKIAIRATTLLQILCVCDIRAAQKRGERSSPHSYITEVCEGGLIG